MKLVRSLVLAALLALFCAGLPALAASARADTSPPSGRSPVAQPNAEAVLAGSCRSHYAEGQKIISGGVLEIEAHGCGLKPWKVYGQFHPYPSLTPPHVPWACNWEFELFGTGRDGRHWESGPLIAGCGPHPYVKWERAFEFKNNTLLCVRGGVHGQGWSPYYACLRMKA